jgi:hypothetical protein
MHDETGDTKATDDDTDQRPASDHWDGDSSPSIAIVEAVAAATDRTATELPPLQYAVDTDALDTLLKKDRSTTVHLQFSYAGTSVSVWNDGSLYLTAE